MFSRRVVVVGTTADYIDLIRRRFPGRALFLTDPAERAAAAEPAPEPPDEVLCDLARPGDVLERLDRHLGRHRIAPAGVAAFDCESMALAAHLGARLSLPYPSAESVAACRSKFASKQLWRRAGVPCPEAELVANADQAAAFLDRASGPVVLKPVTGSGSELLFVCSNAAECAAAVATMKERLARHANDRMYARCEQDGRRFDPRDVFIIEQFVRGPEFSCDFTIDDGAVRVIRIARKIPAPRQPPGTTWAYVVPAELPAEISPDAFRRQLLAAARAVGLDRALCMLDFIVDDGRAVLIEIAPRPGGDCLPPLLRHSAGLDMIGLALDFAEGKSMIMDEPTFRLLVGVRFFAENGGVICGIEDDGVRTDPRVVECRLKARPGRRVVLPPLDYDSRILGYAVFEPSSPDSIESECADIDAKLHIEFEPGG
ncbi:MAG: ATP-grasp domain-containing protein [Planctomycetota bacterium]